MTSDEIDDARLGLFFFFKPRLIKAGLWNGELEQSFLNLQERVWNR